MKKVSTFTERLDELLQRKNLKQADIVSAAGITRSAMSRYMSGKLEPKTATIYAIADAVGVSDRWLYGYDVPMEAPKEKDVIAKMVEESFGSIADTKQLLREALGASAEFNDVYFSDADLESIIDYIRFKTYEKES